ncbi:MAG: hypothetical protein M1837_006926 [Sclerophora amabilis]|nr:MAG: hypothetical protein M1837_006926 [Sclerophora amabilis]
MTSAAAIESVPAPWTCKCDTYWLLFGSQSPLPADVYAPLEAQTSTFADPQKAGKFQGGLGSIQIVRYSSTPAGSYDELLLMPGAFEVPGTSGSFNRITRIYVSQKMTCYNAKSKGRRHWGIPKHLARFSFTKPPTSPSGQGESLKVEVFPPDPSITTPFFTATLQPFQWLPSVPFTTKLMPYFGIETRAVQPPLPASSNPDEVELASSDHWFRILPRIYAARTRGMWANVKRSQKSGEAVEEGGQSWWPDIQPWKVGVWLEDATLELGEPEILN